LGVAAITGAVWTLWHVPVALVLHLGQGVPGRLALVYVLDIAPWALALAALREAHRSVWPAIAGHACLNSVRVFLLQNFVTPEAELGDGQFWVLHALGWLICLVAGFVVLRCGARGRGKLPPGPRQRIG